MTEINEPLSSATQQPKLGRSKLQVLWRVEDQENILKWWKSFEHHRDWSAELRRCETPADVLLTKGFGALLQQLRGAWTRDSQLLSLAAAAGILAHIKVHQSGQGFAQVCGAVPKGAIGPLVSELRFAQLLKSRSVDEFFRRMIRTVGLLKNQADVLAVADGVLQWTHECLTQGEHPNPLKRIKIRWGIDYYNQTNSK